MSFKTISGTVKMGYLKGALNQTAYDAGSPVTIHGSELMIDVGTQGQDMFYPEDGVLIFERTKRQQAKLGLKLKTNRLEFEALKLALFGDTGTPITDYDVIEVMKAANVNALGCAVIDIIDEDPAKPAIKIPYQVINPAPEGSLSISVNSQGEITIDLNPVAPFVNWQRRELS